MREETMKTKVGSRIRRRQAGSTLLELMLAMVILVVGMMGGLALINLAIATNNRNKLDTAGTLLAQSVLEQILAQGATAASTFTVTDCAGNSHVVDPRGNALGKGNGLTKNGKIDFKSAHVPNYQMNYTVCQTAGQTATYDVRWNVTTWTSASTSTTTYTAVVRVAALPLAAETAQTNVLASFAPPVTLSGIAGY